MLRPRLNLQRPPEIAAMGIPRHGEAQPVDDFILPEHWSFHIYGYHALLEIDGVSYDVRPGFASLVPPGRRMVYRYAGASEHVYFHLRCETAEPCVEIPMVMDLGSDFAEMDSRARRAVAGTSRDTPFARATVWSLLCELAERERLTGASPHARHPTVETAIRHIEQRLAGHFTVAQLCEEVGVSYGYLGRLFKRHLGVSVLEHIRFRRADHAEHLLTSTNLPIKVIAHAVGVPDLQQFNRLIRTTKGASPRKLRLAGTRRLA